MSINRRKALGGIAASSLLPKDLFAEPPWLTARRNSRQQTCCPQETLDTSRLEELKQMVEEFDRNQPKKRAMIAAFAEAYMECLWEGTTPTDDPFAVADNMLEFIGSLPPLLQTGLGVGLAWINIRSRHYTSQWFTDLPPAERRKLLNQGEEEETHPLIEWDDRLLAHTIVESLAMVTRLVTNSRTPAKLHVDGMWGPEAKKVSNLANDPLLNKPAYPEWDDDEDEFDVVVIGSGAGGAVVASEALKAGHSCLVIESGDWIHPAQFVQKGFENGQEVVYSAKAEEALRNTYMSSGLNPAGKLVELMKPLDLLKEVARSLPAVGELAAPIVNQKFVDDKGNGDSADTKTDAKDLKKDINEKLTALKVPPGQLVSLVQGNVVGGGPFINNAIHLPINKETWEEWGDDRPKTNGTPLPYEDFAKKMCAVEEKLGVSPVPTAVCTGDDATLLADAIHEYAKKHNLSQECDNMTPIPMPVSIDDPLTGGPKTKSCTCDKNEKGKTCACDENPCCAQPDLPAEHGGCIGGGTDNWLDPHGRHTGGLHPWRAKEPNSYLMDIVKHNANTGKNGIAYKTRAVRFEVEVTPDGKNRNVTHLIIEDNHCDRVQRRKVRAKKFVLAAGAYASTHILMATPYLKRTPGLGSRLNGNVGSPLAAVFGKPVRKEDSDRPYPGIAQCIMVKEGTDHHGDKTPLLENWFGLPGMVAVSVSGWFGENTKVMNNLRNLAICGVALPTELRENNKIDRKGKATIKLDDEEFDLYLNGLRLIAEIFLTAAEKRKDTVEIIFPTKGLILDKKTKKPLRITDTDTLSEALEYIRARGVPFMTIITSHPQGGNPLGVVVDQETFKVKSTDNLYVADASIFPGPCRINPQLTLKALAHCAAEKLIAELGTDMGNKTTV